MNYTNYTILITGVYANIIQRVSRGDEILEMSESAAITTKGRLIVRHLQGGSTGL